MYIPRETSADGLWHLFIHSIGSHWKSSGSLEVWSDQAIWVGLVVGVAEGESTWTWQCSRLEGPQLGNQPQHGLKAGSAALQLCVHGHVASPLWEPIFLSLRMQIMVETYSWSGCVDDLRSCVRWLAYCLAYHKHPVVKVETIFSLSASVLSTNCVQTQVVVLVSSINGYYCLIVTGSPNLLALHGGIRSLSWRSVQGLLSRGVWDPWILSEVENTAPQLSG